MDTYRYDDVWKAEVDRCSEEWRAYCEAVCLLKRFFSLRSQIGRRRAVQDYEAALQRKRDKHGAHGEELAARLRADFMLIGTHEGPRIEQESIDQTGYRPAA